MSGVRIVDWPYNARMRLSLRVAVLATLVTRLAAFPAQAPTPAAGAPSDAEFWQVITTASEPGGR
jgi:hypothetical protein